MAISDPQKHICDRFGAAPFAADPGSVAGLARNVREGILPLNGLRIPPHGGASGWYIWSGEELSQDPDFFVPVHIEHLDSWCPQAIPYLQLPPGWRFLLAPGYEDVWRDESLLTRNDS